MRRYSMQIHPVKPWEVVLWLTVGMVIPVGVFAAVVWGFMALLR